MSISKTQIKSIILYSVGLFLYHQFLGSYLNGLSPFNQILLLTSLHSKILLKSTFSETKDFNYVAISPNEQTLVSGNEDGLKTWDLKTSELKSVFTGLTKGVRAVAISPDGQILASGNEEGVNIWDLNTGNLKATLTVPIRGVVSIAISPDGQTLVSGNRDNTVKIWNLKTAELITTLPKQANNKTRDGYPDGVNSVAISSDGQTLVSGRWDNIIEIWNLKTRQRKNTINVKVSKSNFLNCVAISPDGQTVVSGSDDGTIKIWNSKTSELKNTLNNHQHITTIAISPNGQTIVSGSLDNTIKVWSLKTGELKSSLIGHTGPVSSVAISSDGQTIVSGSWDKTVKIWQMP
jgi:WD40 repeat protein